VCFSGSSSNVLFTIHYLALENLVNPEEYESDVIILDGEVVDIDSELGLNVEVDGHVSE